MSVSAEPRATRDRLIDPADPKFALQMAILSFVVVVHSDGTRALVGALLAVAALVYQRLLISRAYWGFVVAVMSGWFLLEWPLLDNHVALSVYWAGAVLVALGSTRWPERLRENARWVIVTVFGLAVFWKLASQDFLSGAFFEWTLLVDSRFEPVASLLGVSGSALAENRQLVADGAVATLNSADNISAAAQLLTWGTIILESAVAIAWALGDRLGVLKHALLVAFAVITYVMVPVAGFGFMLLVMGVATVTTTRARVAYAGGAGALLLYSIVWTALVL